MYFLIIIKGKYIGCLETVVFGILYITANTGPFGDSRQITVELLVTVELIACTNGVAETQFL